MDEVNLLDDGLVDVVLDSAASGVNTVEREGVSIVHPAKFIMIGSGNPGVGGGGCCVVPGAWWCLVVVAGAWWRLVWGAWCCCWWCCWWCRW